MLEVPNSQFTNILWNRTHSQSRAGWESASTWGCVSDTEPRLAGLSLSFHRRCFSHSKMIWKDGGKFTYWFPSTLKARSSTPSVMFRMMECEIKGCICAQPVIANLVDVFKEYREGSVRNEKKREKQVECIREPEKHEKCNKRRGGPFKNFYAQIKVLSAC